MSGHKLLWPNQRLQDSSLRNITQRFISLTQSILTQLYPRPYFRSFCDKLRAAIEVGKLRSPATTNIEMFSVQIKMRIERSHTVIGVLANNHHRPCVTRKPHRLNHSVRNASRFDGYIRAAS